MPAGSAGTYYVLKKALSLLLACTLVAGSMTVAASAADTAVVNSIETVENQHFSQDDMADEKQCDVKASRGTAFLVIIPKVITLDSNGNASYKVTVDADLAGTEYIEVTYAPKAEGDFANYTLVEAGGKEPINYVVTQPKQIFIAEGSVDNFTASNGDNLQALAAEVADYTIVNKEAAIVDGSVAAPAITAGSWTGAFDFNIALETKVVPAPEQNTEPVGD